jgi:hypothetical protein
MQRHIFKGIYGSIPHVRAGYVSQAARCGLRRALGLSCEKLRMKGGRHEIPGPVQEDSTRCS